MVGASGEDSAALSEERKAWSPIDGAGEHVPHPQGKDIFTNGLPAQGTPACAICHGADGAGSATFPRIAGQHSDYLAKQGYSRTRTNVLAVVPGKALLMRLRRNGSRRLRLMFRRFDGGASRPT